MKSIPLTGVFADFLSFSSDESESDDDWAFFWFLFNWTAVGLTVGVTGARKQMFFFQN